jgi:hypothetical protein
MTTCNGARRCVISALDKAAFGLTIDEAWEEINWWTKETIKETLLDLTREGIIRQKSGGIFAAMDHHDAAAR